jgi:hypothetical protein
MIRRGLLALLLLAGCTWSNSRYQARSLSGAAARAERGGRAADADGLWNQAAVKAESALARSPHGMKGAESRWLLGRALARARDCDRGRPYLENALSDAPRAKWSEALQLELARCVETVDTVRAAALFGALRQSRDAATRREAREHAGRDLVATGQPAAALEMLTGVESPTARLDRAVALAQLDRPDSAFAEVAPLLELPTVTPEWDRLLAVLASGHGDAVDRLLAQLALMPNQAPQELNEWRLAALRGTRLDDTTAFSRRLALLLSGRPGQALVRGRVIAAERTVARSRDLATLVRLRDSLSRVSAPTGDLIAGQQWTRLTFLVGRIVDEQAAVPAGAPTGDMVTFAHAELARDSLHAAQLSTTLFAAIEHGWPTSPFVPKAILARVWAQPDSAEALRLRAAGFTGSPYLAYLRGSDDSSYHQLEDSLGAFIKALALKAAKANAVDVIK